MMLLFLWWPYQKWAFAEKVSVFTGWARVIAADQSGEWIFCPFVPLVSIWLAWRSRARLKSQPLRGHASGLGVLMLGAFVFWAGYKAGTGYPGFVATQLMLAGLIVWLCGWAWMRVLMFPWLFLLFMWPSFPLEAQVAVPMRLLAASLTAKLLGLMGIAAVNAGTAVLSAADPGNGLAEGARFKLDVAAACSGIRSLYALLMLAAFSGYILFRRWLPRALLFLSALPLALIGNIVRLMLLALGTLWMGEEFAIGRKTPDGQETSWFHQFAGLAVYAAALGGMFGLCSLLERSRWSRKLKPASDASDRTGDDTLRITALRSLVAVVFSGAVLGWCALAGNNHAGTEAGVNPDLPRHFGAAQGTELPMSQRERLLLDADVTLNRMMYTSPTALETQLTVVLDGASGRGLHQPEVCAVAQAWRILDQRRITVQCGGRAVDATMLRLYLDMQDRVTGRVTRQRGIHIFWYQGARGVSAATHFGHRFKTYRDSVFRNVKHRWALMSFSTYLPGSAPVAANDPAEDAALADLQVFIAEMGPKLLKP